MNRLQSRRGALGADLYRSDSTGRIAIPLSELSPLRMVKQEALEDMLQNKNRKFMNLTAVRDQYRITIINGRLYYKGFPLTTREDGRFKFIQDQSGDMFGVETSDDPDGIKHSSLLGKSWPISAGTIVATNGVVQVLSGSSGHFQPSINHLTYTENYLRQNDVLVLQFLPFWTSENKARRVKRDVASYVKKYMSS
ncbi:hypothetical protein [Pseudomonas laurentiana]|uniref:hypothetical protein n=1 Tax=Pseudomonas laurentiana TaxID=2364649 RepID=UPI001674C48D|nr:hypothetical protein [Pseudomonas laurentiana]